MNQAPQTSSASRAWARIGEQWAKRGRIRCTISASDAVVAGQELIKLKSVTPHGEFMLDITALGLSPNTAARYIDAAYSFKQAPEAFLDAVVSASKLFELLPVADLLVFNEKAVMAAHPNGQTVELPFTELALMTTKDVRQTVRELRQPLAAGPKQDGAAPVPSEVLSEEEQVLLQRYRQCPQVAQSCLQLMAGLLVTTPS